MLNRNKLNADKYIQHLKLSSTNRKRIFKFVVSAFRLLFLISIGYIVFFPIFSAISSSLKTEAAHFDLSLYWLPRDITFEHFKTAVEVLRLPDSFIKTLSVNIVAALIEVVICAITAYGFSRFDFKLKKILQVLLILSILVPMQFYIVSIVINYKHLDVLGLLGLLNKVTNVDLRLDVLDTNWTFYFPSLFGVGLRSGILIYIYMQFFSGLPKELEEAAWIDGAGPFKTFVKIAVPSSTVVIFVVTVFSMIWHYNDYYLSVMFFSGDFPMAVRLATAFDYLKGSAKFASVSSNEINSVVMAGCLIFILPMLIFYMFVQKKFVQSIDRIGITG